MPSPIITWKKLNSRNEKKGDIEDEEEIDANKWIEKRMTKQRYLENEKVPYLT